MKPKISNMPCVVFFFFSLAVYYKLFFLLCQVLVMACRIFDLHCDVQNL